MRYMNLAASGVLRTRRRCEGILYSTYLVWFSAFFIHQFSTGTKISFFYTFCRLHCAKFNILKASPITVLFVGLSAFIAYSLFRKGAAAGNLVFFPKGIKSVGFESGSPVITLNLGIANTSNQSFTIQSIAGNLYTNNTYVGYVSNFGGITAPPNSETILPLKIKLGLLGVVSELIEALQGSGWSQDLELDLRANIDNLQVPVKIKYKLG